MGKEALILISTGDVDLYLLLNHVLEAEGFETRLVSEPREIQRAGEKNGSCLVLCDTTHGGPPAADMYRHTKRTGGAGRIPFMALVNADDVTEHVSLLKSGIDEVLTRPVSPTSLLERIRVLLGGETESQAEAVVSYADVEMNLDKWQVQRSGRGIHLGPIEFKLLKHLLQNPGQVFTRDELISAAWPPNVYVVQRTVDVHMGRLRKALKKGPDGDLIRTVRSVGYGLAD